MDVQLFQDMSSLFIWYIQISIISNKHFHIDKPIKCLCLKAFLSYPHSKEFSI